MTTPIEAIDAAIAREENELRELAELEKEADRIAKEMDEAFDSGDMIRKELEGKRTARREVVKVLPGVYFEGL